MTPVQLRMSGQHDTCTSMLHFKAYTATLQLRTHHTVIVTKNFILPKSPNNYVMTLKYSDYPACNNNNDVIAASTYEGLCDN